MWEHFAPGGAIRVAGHHFARRFLARGARVAWCAGPVTPVNFVKRNEETRARMRLWRRGGETGEEGAFFAYAPMTLLPYRRAPGLDSARVARRTLAFTTPPLRRVLDRAGFGCPDLLFMEPGAPHLALLEEFPAARAIYRMCDDTAAFADAPRSFARVEAETVRRVDLVIAAAGRLAERARALGARRVLRLPNACDPAPFAAGGPEPSDLARLPRPRVVYAGALEGWLDADLLRDAARRLPRWSFVLIGPERAPLAALRGLANVVLLGPRPYETLPAYFAACDAAIVPFRATAMTHAIHPIKVYEYLAAGLPVVSTPLEETAAMQAPIRLAAGAAEFAAALEEALAEPAGRRAERLLYAGRNTWRDRFETLAAAIRDLGRPEAPAAAAAAPAGRRAAGDAA